MADDIAEDLNRPRVDFVIVALDASAGDDPINITGGAAVAYGLKNMKEPGYLAMVWSIKTTSILPMRPFDVRLHLEDVDGKPVGGQFDWHIDKHPHSGHEPGGDVRHTRAINVPLPINHSTPLPVVFSAVLSVDGRRERRVPFRVLEGVGEP